MRVLPRSVEGVVGEKLIKWGTKHELKKAKLVRKKVVLPKHNNLDVHYLEREPDDDLPFETVVFCHGIADRAEYMSGFVNALDMPSNVRVLIPDAVGHGHDLKRAKHCPEEYQHPTPTVIVETTCEFLDVLGVEKCHVVGISMGGALAYWVHQQRPLVVHKAVLVAPAIETCVDEAFLNDFVTGKKRHFCFNKRSELKHFLRELCPPQRKYKDPVPKFFLQGIVRERHRKAPPEHYFEMMHVMLDNKDKDDLWNATKDVHPEAERLVLWPDQDYICNHSKGQVYFEASTFTEFETLENCGHAFSNNGKSILIRVAPRVSQYLFEEEKLEQSREKSQPRDQAVDAASSGITTAISSF